MDGIAEILDVVEHLVGVNNFWNGSLSQVDALAKIAAARAKLVVPDVEEVVGDVKETVTDVKKTVKDAEGE